MVIKGTSCYDNAKSGNLVSITGDGGNAWGFYGNSYKKMSPRLYLWQYYDSNPYNLSEAAQPLCTVARKELCPKRPPCREMKVQCA